MSESDDICKQLPPAMTMKKEVEEETDQAPLEDALKEKVEPLEVEDGNQEALKEKVEVGTQEPKVLEDEAKLKKKKNKKTKKKEEWRKFIGVRKSCGMFSAQIRVPESLGGYRAWIGTYKSPKVAALAYDQAAYKLYGSQATLNFPDRIIPNPSH